jgi:glycosyltransferase involved in cell wall biosynthesis
MLRCSVVVSTYQRVELLSRTLDALTAQTMPPDEYEIIVCDDGKNDATRGVVEHWQAAGRTPIRYLSRSAPNQGLAAMRNAGWRAAHGDIVAFTRDDASPDHDWVRQGLLALADDAADAAVGRVFVQRPDDAAGERRGTMRLESQRFVTANCFCRRSVLASVGGFDASDRADSHEDGELLAKLTAKGFDVVHAIDAVVAVSHRWPEARTLPYVFDVILTSLVMSFASAFHRRRGSMPFRVAHW